jgi:hypothetical protein
MKRRRHMRLETATIVAAIINVLGVIAAAVIGRL